MTKKADVGIDASRSLRAMREQWPQFTAMVATRLEAGAREYGDKSFSRSPSALIDEIKQELLDVCGWGFILWDRLDRAEHALACVEARLKARKVGGKTCRSVDTINGMEGRKARRPRR